MITSTPPNHIGRKISRIRELRGMKQETIASELGLSQQTISNIENSETIEKKLLEQVAKVLGVTPEGIENFSEEKVFNIISNTFTSNDTSTLNAINIYPSFNPIDKLLEVFEEKEKLYERLLEAEKEKVKYLEQLLESRNL